MNFKYLKIALLLSSAFLASCSELSTEEVAVEDLQALDQTVTFNPNVAPIITSNCVECHSGAAARGGVRLENFSQVRAAIERVNIRMNDERNPMPPSGVLAPEIRQIVTQWISDGLLEGEGDIPVVAVAPEEVVPVEPEPVITVPDPVVAPAPVNSVTFTSDISPVIANNCLGCHSGATPRGGISLETFEQVRAASARIVVRINDVANPMPPGLTLLPLETRQLFDQWINNGLVEN